MPQDHIFPTLKNEAKTFSVKSKNMTRAKNKSRAIVDIRDGVEVQEAVALPAEAGEVRYRGVLLRGTTFANPNGTARQTLLRELRDRHPALVKIWLQPEPNNPVDPHAVQLRASWWDVKDSRPTPDNQPQRGELVRQDQMLGFLPRALVRDEGFAPERLAVGHWRVVGNSTLGMRLELTLLRGLSPTQSWKHDTEDGLFR